MKPLLLSQITFGSDFKTIHDINFNDLIDHARSLKASNVPIKTGTRIYPVIVHSPQIAELIQGEYTGKELEILQKRLKKTTHLPVSDRGLIGAANRETTGTADPTHYDAIWIRDSLWSYLGLSVQKDRQNEAPQVLRTLLDYLASPAQMDRMFSVIHDPNLLIGSRSHTKAIHVRFDAKSLSFDDVRVNGKVQNWNHKQNDALGLLLDLAVQNHKHLNLTDQHFLVLAGLPAYFARNRFFEMEDAGAWEEIERVNTSSIGLVTSGLERLFEKITGNTREQREFSRRLLEAAKKEGTSKYLRREALKSLIDHGYNRIDLQLKAGGESPLYLAGSPRYRMADAALLNLIFPARLKRLTRQQKFRIITLLQPLIGRVGIKRYLGDSYQSGNFWFNQFETLVNFQKTKSKDTRSAFEFSEREKQWIPETEAQWFFDSWYSKAMGMLYRTEKTRELREQQIQFFNRALGQITGDPGIRQVLGADGRPVPLLALPESYNLIVNGPSNYYLPSPITPLNWSKACLLLAFEELKATIQTSQSRSKRSR